MTEIICHHQGFIKRKAKSISLGKKEKCPKQTHENAGRKERFKKR